MKTIYLDMDDVTADFKSYAIRVLGEPSEYTGRWSEEQWAKLAENERLYRDLDKTPGADLLIDFCREFSSKNSWDLKFLSAVPKGNDMHWAFYDKMLWAIVFYPDIPVMFGPFSKDKHVHCKPGDILIDDRESNCNEWTAAGGIAIRHLGDMDSTLAQLKSILGE
jgi:hypothetical protein